MSSNGVCFSPGAYFGFGFTPASFGPCSVFARASEPDAASNVAPAPSFKKSRLRNHNAFGVIRIPHSTLPTAKWFHSVEKQSRLGFGGFCFAYDRRHRRRQLRRVGRSRGERPLVPRVPALPRRALLVGRKLGPVRIADEPRARPARAVGAPFHAAAHVQRAPRPLLLGRQPDDALGRNRGGQLALGSEPAVALENALLLRGRKLARVLPAEPAVARPRSGLAAAGHRAEPDR